jgi:hypothetical protein
LNACFTSAAGKPRLPLSKNALSFTAWLRLVQVMLRELLENVGYGVSIVSFDRFVFS